MTQHVRKLAIVPRALGFGAGVRRGMAVSDFAFDSDLARVRLRNFRDSMSYDLETLREDFIRADRRFRAEQKPAES
ncbi:MAG: hypothetical protein Q4G22_07405 [Paracoccus sp. (in: a-proteobacteria)]|uniref:hypothetical protein n=1 Tax=Paracoccus sp. TaxID=267 RepID=UPI0026E0A447|nr:hypothetical protein [Paracoccus sp. (in: a-proteobacteria)]MDO5631648.1 hypothetical protein [Paracoccus sp. (in: a-proteobacteria)]